MGGVEEQYPARRAHEICSLFMCKTLISRQRSGGVNDDRRYWFRGDLLAGNEIASSVSQPQQPSFISQFYMERVRALESAPDRQHGKRISHGTA